jgi:hypothetical protein
LPWPRDGDSRHGAVEGRRLGLSDQRPIELGGKRERVGEAVNVEAAFEFGDPCAPSRVLATVPQVLAVEVAKGELGLGRQGAKLRLNLVGAGIGG